MAIATVTPTEWGYSVTGDTDATTINSGRLRVKAIGFSGNADAATAVITTLENLVAVSAGKFMANDTGELSSASGNFMYFGEKGIPMTGLAVTLGHGSSHLYVYLTS